MAIMDSDIILAVNYAPTATGTTYPAYTYDFGSQQDWGMGADLGLLITTATSFSTGSSPTLQVILQGNGTDSSFATGTTYTLIDTTALTATATTNPMSAGYWQAGFVRQYKYPRGFSIRYVRLSVVVGTAAFTSGAFNAWLNVDNFQDNILTAKAGYTVQ